MLIEVGGSTGLSPLQAAGFPDLCKQDANDLAYFIAEAFVLEATVGVEAVHRATQREFSLDHSGTGCAEHLAQIGLRPNSSENADARADDRDRLAAKRALGNRRPRKPVDGVLQGARNRRVVLRGGK